MDGRSALLIGATGLVGGHCLELLLKEDAYTKVTALVRRRLDVVHPKLEQHVIEFSRLKDYEQLIRAQDVYCCLGTTIKKAGSQAAFRQVDFSYQYEVAESAARNGAERLLLVSSLGADARSSIFYSRVKGELEEAVAALAYSAVLIFRPSLLLGERAEPRLGERLAESAMSVLSFVLVGPLRKYRPVEARAVASAMVRCAAEHQTRGVHVFESDRIREMNER